MEDTKRLHATWREESANEYLPLGWKLIAIGSEMTGPETISIKYKLAWQAECDPVDPESKVSDRYL